MIATAGMGIEELDRRYSDGVDVALFWNPRTNRVFVAVEDERRGASFRIDVAPANALDAFHHPYVYAEGTRERDFAIAA
jgi:hypothetical protein